MSYNEAPEEYPDDTRQNVGASELKAMLDAVPSNWCDPLLTGPRAVIGRPPYDCQDIERLLNAVREQVRQASNAKLTGGPSGPSG